MESRGIRSGDQALGLLMTVAEVAEDLRISRTAVYQLMAAGDLPSLNLGRSAVRIQSARFGGVWIALEESAVGELAAEESGRAEPRPILRADEVARLRGRKDEAIRAALEIARAFPGSRIVQ